MSDPAALDMTLPVATPPAPGALRRLVRRPLALLGLVLVAAVVIGAVFAPWLTPYDPSEQFFDGLSLEGAPLGPSAQYWLGTDLLGRDLLTRILYGARTSLVIGVAANGVALLIGSAVGIVAGYFGGLLGSALMRFTDLMMAFPALLLAICLAAILQPSLWIVAMVIALVYWVQIARVVYTETRALAERDFIAAERSLGAGPVRILAQAHPAAPLLDDHRLGHARHLDHGAARGDAVLSRRRRAAADALLGQHHLREPDLLPGGAVAGVLSRHRHPGAGARLQPRRRRAARRARPDRAGQGLMAVYLSRRIVQAVLILLGVSIITFALLYLLPADPVRQIAGRSATPQTVENIRRQLGLDQSFVVQYWRYLANLVQGDLGRSYLQRSRSRGTDLGAAAGDAAADGGRHRLRTGHRADHGAAGRGQARHGDRPGADGGLLRRRLGAAVRRRADPALRIRGQAVWLPISGYGTWRMSCCRR